MLRSFYIKNSIKTVQITESERADTVTLTVFDKNGHASTQLSHAEFKELASLVDDSDPSNSINWAS